MIRNLPMNDIVKGKIPEIAKFYRNEFNIDYGNIPNVEFGCAELLVPMCEEEYIEKNHSVILTDGDNMLIRLEALDRFYNPDSAEDMIKKWIIEFPYVDADEIPKIQQRVNKLMQRNHSWQPGIYWSGAHKVFINSYAVGNISVNVDDVFFMSMMQALGHETSHGYQNNVSKTRARKPASFPQEIPFTQNEALAEILETFQKMPETIISEGLPEYMSFVWQCNDEHNYLTELNNFSNARNMMASTFNYFNRARLVLEKIVSDYEIPLKIDEHDSDSFWQVLAPVTSKTFKDENVGTEPFLCPGSNFIELYKDYMEIPGTKLLLTSMQHSLDYFKWLATRNPQEVEKSLNFLSRALHEFGTSIDSSLSYSLGLLAVHDFYSNLVNIMGDKAGIIEALAIARPQNLVDVTEKVILKEGY